MSFVLFECVIAVAVLLALAELASWWVVAALPAAVAVMVKLNDLVTGGQVGTEPTAATAAPTYELPALPARSSRIYVSSSHVPTSQVPTGPAGPPPSGSPVSRATPADPGGDPPRTATRRGVEHSMSRPIRSAGGNRSASRARAARQPRVVESGTERREVVERPEWRQTITLGRHARDDAGRGRGPDAEHETDDARHRAGPANQRRFA
jgi:hypothetical protein